MFQKDIDDLEAEEAREVKMAAGRGKDHYPEEEPLDGHQQAVQEAEDATHNIGPDATGTAR